MAQVKEVKGPGPRRMGGPKPKVENPGKLLKRIMAEVFQHYLPHCILVLICIVVSALANVQASLFLQTLIDDYITPMIGQAHPDYGPLADTLFKLGLVLAFIGLSMLGMPFLSKLEKVGMGVWKKLHA